MIKHILVTDESPELFDEHEGRLVVNSTDFVANQAQLDLRKNPRLKMINLCNDYDYLSTGYYCSLLAEARGIRCVPNVSHMITLNWKRFYQSALPELNTLLEKHFTEDGNEPLTRTYNVYFGRTETPALEPIARRMFDLFRFPLMAVQLQFTKKWAVSSISPITLDEIPESKLPFFNECLNKFTGAAWTDRGNNTKQEKYWVGILYDPEEKMPPSNKGAMAQFMKTSAKMGIYTELITRNDYASLLEYDALLIRATTSIENYTFRFAHKAAEEGIPCIDDERSIIRCCNKVFMHELMEANGVPVLKTEILDRRKAKEIESKVDYPVVLKIPDGSFSFGLVKAENIKDFREGASKLFKDSDIILAQQFMPSTFDWRIGILGGRPLYACKYFMAKDHWQIYNHSAAKVSAQSGAHLTMDVTDVPKDVMDVAIKAANLIGNGLYGVDLKQTENGVYVIEINDNPSIDKGVEDQVLGDKLYQAIFERLIHMIEGKRHPEEPLTTPVKAA